MSKAPVNHVGMTVAIDDLPPLIWHAELGDKLTDVWTGGNHRGVQLNDARQAVERWMNNYRPALLAAPADALRHPRAGGPGAEGGRPDGRHAVSQHRAADRPMVSRPGAHRGDWTRGIPFLDSKVRESSRRRKERSARSGWKPPTARRPSPSPTRRWACSRPTKTRTGLTRASSGAATRCRWRPDTSSATKSPSWSDSGVLEAREAGVRIRLGDGRVWLENLPTTPVSVTSTLSAWMPSG